uniref:Ubiquitin-like domain-containing protein n=1 Tax=Nelumbo nucifera TaxID=4432 RepID=A0A822XWZ6_NELNU|nr:TPA_asm: hypothetical protein HUJ06_024748 [Nelumbo nucifera]
MRLVVEVLTGTLFYVQVDDNATVGDLKREIGAQEKLPEDRLILVLHNHNHHGSSSVMVDDKLSLLEYGVRDGSHIHLCFYPLDDAAHYHLLFTLPDSLTW